MCWVSLLELPGMEKRLASNDNIVLLSLQHRKAGPGWEHLKVIGQRQGVSVGDLWAQNRPGRQEVQGLIHELSAAEDLARPQR